MVVLLAFVQFFVCGLYSLQFLPRFACGVRFVPAGLASRGWQANVLAQVPLWVGRPPCSRGAVHFLGPLEAVEDFKDDGGENLHVIPCLNDRDSWVEVIGNWLNKWEKQDLLPL